jgi:hypothetical protein
VAAVDRAEAAAPGRWLRRSRSLEVLAGVLVVLVLVRSPLSSVLTGARLQTWSTVFLAVVVQSVPFLMLGVVLSAVIAVFVPTSFFERALPRSRAADGQIVSPARRLYVVPVVGLDSQATVFKRSFTAVTPQTPSPSNPRLGTHSWPHTYYRRENRRRTMLINNKTARLY